MAIFRALPRQTHAWLACVCLFCVAISIQGSQMLNDVEGDGAVDVMDAMLGLQPTEGVEILAEEDGALENIEAAPIVEEEPHELELVAAVAKVPDVFTSTDPREGIIPDLVNRFVDVYQEEVSQTALSASLLQVLKAQKTGVRTELQQEEIDTGDGNAIDFVEEAVTQQFRIFLLMKYHFQTSMFESKRPYVSVVRLTMDCANSTFEFGETELGCDILEHMDLPRVNESTKSVPVYIQRQIRNSAPASFLANHTLKVIYDAIESQYLMSDTSNGPIHDVDTIHYVRFRVYGGNSQDCMMVIQHAEGINTLLYTDNVCYDLSSPSLAMAAYQYTKENFTAFVLIASFAGAFVAMLIIIRHRKKQRLGYSYLHTKNLRLPRVPAKQKDRSNDTFPATAC